MASSIDETLALWMAAFETGNDPSLESVIEARGDLRDYFSKNPNHLQAAKEELRQLRVWLNATSSLAHFRSGSLLHDTSVPLDKKLIQEILDELISSEGPFAGYSPTHILGY